MEERCVCRHPWAWHHGVGSRPCGSGDCLCRVYVEADKEPVQARVAPNLWGELQAVPDDSGEVA